MKRLVGAAVVCFLTLAGVGTASAALVATLNFTTPTGIVGPTDSIPVWMTLALDPSSEAIITDSFGNVTSLTAADINANLFADAVAAGLGASDATTTNLNDALGCSGTFFSGCGGSPYGWNWNSTAATDFAFADNLDLEPGSISSYLIGTLVPAGVTAPGTYTLPYIEVFAQVWDFNLIDPYSGTIPFHLADVFIADTSGGPSFTRTVEGSAVPEPGTWMLMLTGLSLAVGAARRKTKA